MNSHSHSVPVSRASSPDEIRGCVARWVEAQRAPRPGATRRRAGERRSARCGRDSDYEAWYPTFADSGLAVATWPTEYLGLDLTSGAGLGGRRSSWLPFNLGRLNPLGLNSAAPALFAHGTEEQRRRYLPPMVRNQEKWCQLLSEPGAGSDLASLGHPGDP